MKNQHKKTKSIKIFLIISIFLLVSSSLTILGVAEDEEDEEDGKDRAKNLGIAAFGLFAISLLYVFFSQIMRLSMKLNKEKERNVEFKANYQKFFKVIRKPLLIVHYLASSTAIVLLAIHGLGMLPEDNEQAVLGIITGSLLAFYILTGVIVKFILPKFKKTIKLRKYMYFIHRSLIVILIVLAIHISHVAS